MSAGNPYSLAAAFLAQKDSDQTKNAVGKLANQHGAIITQKAFETQIDYPAEYTYSGADLAGALALALPRIGCLVGGKFLTKVELKFAPQAAVVISIAGHQHTDNAHPANSTTPGDFAGYSVPWADWLPASWDGWGVPDIWDNANADAEITDLTLSVEVSHDDRVGKGGLHALQAATHGGMATISASYNDTPTLTTTGWTMDAPGDHDRQNTAEDTSKASGSMPLVRYVVPTP